MASPRLIVVVTSAILTFTIASCKDEVTKDELPPGTVSPASELPEGVTHLGSDVPGKASGPEFQVQEGWTEVPPTRPTRTAQYRIEDGPIDLVVFAWNDDVGGLESNIANWIGSDRERGSLTPEELTSFEVEGGYTVTTLFLEREGPAPEDSAHGPTGDAIFKAYIQKDGDPRTWTLTADGPPEAMVRQRPAFDAFVRSL